MKKKSMFYLLMLVAFVLEASHAHAEYRAITKFPTPEAGRDKDGKPLELPARGADETDFKACQAITDNINAMERYHINWECDFPISANNYLLSKPQWTEVTGDEKRKALEAYKQVEDVRPVFSFPYNVDAIDGDEYIYIRPQLKMMCKSGSKESRALLWFSEKSNLWLINNDVVLFASRLYFVDYISDGYQNKETFRNVPPKSFSVTTLRKQEPYTGLKVLGGVCAIRSVNP